MVGCLQLKIYIFVFIWQKEFPFTIIKTRKQQVFAIKKRFFLSYKNFMEKTA